MVTRIGQRLTTAISDKQVTKAEAEQIVAEAKVEKKWTPQLQTEVKNFVQKNGAKMEPAAKAVLEQFLASARPKTDLADPALLKADRTSVTWAPVAADASLYVDTLSADDVAQGYIGDCYLASGISRRPTRSGRVATRRSATAARPAISFSRSRARPRVGTTFAT